MQANENRLHLSLDHSMMNTIKNDSYFRCKSMYVCVCNAVTDKAIQQAVQQGHDSFEAIQGELSVGTCCGRCKPFACELIDQCLEKRSASHACCYAEACA